MRPEKIYKALWFLVRNRERERVSERGKSRERESRWERENE